MSEIKISELTEATTVAANDLIIVVSSPGANAVTKKMTMANFMANVVVVGKHSANLSVANVAVFEVNTFIMNSKATPASSSPTIRKGAFFFDDSYLYIAVANNSVKRVALSSF